MRIGDEELDNLADYGRGDMPARELKALDMVLAELQMLRAERAALVELVEDGPEFFSDQGECDPGVDDEPCPHEPPCWSHRRRALLAKLKETP